MGEPDPGFWKPLVLLWRWRSLSSVAMECSDGAAAVWGSLGAGVALALPLNMFVALSGVGTGGPSSLTSAVFGPAFPSEVGMIAAFWYAIASTWLGYTKDEYPKGPIGRIRVMSALPLVLPAFVWTATALILVAGLTGSGYLNGALGFLGFCGVPLVFLAAPLWIASRAERRLRQPLERPPCRFCGFNLAKSPVGAACPKCGDGSICPTCGYALAGLPVGSRCPECGWLHEVKDGVDAAHSLGDASLERTEASKKQGQEPRETDY